MLSLRCSLNAPSTAPVFSRFTTLASFLTLGLWMLLAPSVHAQCPNDNDAWLTWDFTTEGETASTSCIFSGEHNILEVLEAATYEVNTCASSWDTQLTIYDVATGAVVAYDDNGCGLQSTVTFTAAQDGTYLLVMDDASCSVPVGTECGYMEATLVNLGIPGACANAVVAVSGEVYDFNLAAGNGELNPSDGPNGTPGDEVVYEFTATVNGTHNVTVTNDDGLVDLFVGEVCSEDDFTYVEQVSQFHLHSLDLVAGSTYYFMVDDQNTTTNTGTFTITDPNYCGSGINESHALVANDTLTIQDNTSDLPDCCFFQPSNDATYELIVPESGSLWISACGSSFDTYMYLSTSTCGGITLAENDDFCGSQSLIEVDVTAGTYYVTLEGSQDTEMGAFELEILNTPFAPYSVHSKHASSQQGEGLKYGSSVAMSGDVLVVADAQEHVEVLRKAADGSWALEAIISAPSADISFGAREALATNGDWIAIGAKLDDTYASNAGAVHMYKFDGTNWGYEGSLSHMAPFGSLVTDQFGMAVAMDGDRMVVGSRAENGVGAAGAVHYFQYNTMLDMWVESGFIASEHTSGNSTSKFGESVDISGDYLIVGEHRNNTNGNFAGAVHIYSFYNQCWHIQNVFYGHEANDQLGRSVAISGDNAVAGSPFADMNGLNESGAATLYQLTPFSGGESFWSETFHFAPDGTAAGDWFGDAVDIDGGLLAIGVPRDDEYLINGGAGYFLFDCTGGSLNCVNEGFACDAMQNDRLGFDVAVSGELAAIGATLDDNIYDDAGSVYILGSNDIGFECDLTAPGDTETDLISADDSGASASDDTTRNTTPDFDVFLPGGSGLSVTEGYLAQAGDALIFYLEGSGDSTTVILSEDDIDSGVYNFEFVYPGPVLEDGVYTFCSYLIDVFGNVGSTDCVTIVVDNEDPEPVLDFGASAIAGSDTTLYLDNSGNVVLNIEGSDNISATDNIAMDTLYADITDFDCDDAGTIVEVTLTAVDLAGNISTTTFDLAIEDDIAPVVSVQNVTVQLQMTGTGSLTAAQADNGTTDNCGIDNLAISQTTFDCDDVGDQTVVFTATDLSGNTTTANFTVTVEFNQAPNANAQDVTLELDANGNANTTAAAVDNGSGSACAIGSLSLSQTDFTCADLGDNPVTLTVIDSYGNVSTATATVTVVDLLAPTPVTQNVTLQLDSAGMVSLTAAEVDNGTIENCSLDNLAISQTDFDCTDVGTSTLEFSARDISGNTATTNFTVTVEDNVAPEAIAQDLTIQLDATGNAATTAAAVDNGSNDACGIASRSLSQTNFGCADLGPNNVTLTVTDNNGNESTTTAVVTVEDIAPTIAIAQDLTVELDAAGIAFITAPQADNGSNDPCGIASTTVSQSGFDCDDLGANEVDFSATDINGNTATVTFTVTVQDNIDPTLSGTPSNITLSVAAGTCGAAATWTDPAVADNCSATLSSSHTSGATFDVGVTTVTFTATDIAGNTATSSFTVTVTDNEAPVISDTPAAMTQSSDAGNCSAVVNWTAPTAADNCGVDSMTGDAASGDTFPVGTTTVTYTATDIHGNTATSSFTVTVTDDEAPVISDKPTNITQTADAGQCAAGVTWTAPTASDNCGIATLTADADPGDTFPVGTTTVTYTAADIHGNITTASFDITVTDDESPAITGMPSNITQSNDAGICGAAVNWTAPAGTDNCTVASLTSTHDIGDTFPVGTTNVTYTVTDAAGNTNTSSFTVTVTDDEAPVISNVPADFTVLTASGESTAIVTWPELPAAAPEASDNCGVTSFTSTHASGDTFNEGTTTVTYTAMDAAGNTTTASFTVTVSDGEAPIISGNPTDITQTADAGVCSAVVNYTAPTATDNVEVVSFSGDAASGDTFPVGTTTVTYTAIDDAGNTTTSDFTVTITDDEAPAIADTPANITQTADAGQCSAVINYTAPTASDNCAVTSFSGDAASGDAFPVGTTTVTYTAVDPAGNTTTTSFTVTITDDEAPAIAGTPSNFNQTADAGICGAAISWTDLTASDNCAVASLSGTHDSGDTFPVGTTTVTFTASDIHGNTTTSTFTVTITDDEDPSISGTPEDITQTADAGVCGAAVSYTPPTAADNCGVDSFTSTHDSGDTFAVGTTTVTYTATDAAGNTTTSSFTVTVSDDESPVIAGMPGNITQSNDAGACSAVVSYTAPTASDNCGIASFSGDAASGDTFPVGTTTVTYTASDIHGNSTTASFTITVTDSEAPVISGTPTNITQTADAGQCSSAVTYTAPTAADNCGMSAFFGDATSGDIFPVGTTTVTYTASDIHGNINTASFTITVTDDENPVISPTAEDVTYQRDGNEGTAYDAWIAGYGGAAATDNCGIDAWTDNSTGLSDGCGSTGTETVTFTVTDIHSNSSSTTATFTVIDDFAPSCPIIDLTDGSDNGLSGTDNVTNDDTPTMRVLFTGSGVESAEEGDIVQLYIEGILSEAKTVTASDVANG
ncbi:HYR domain-containing protein, partial [Flavobacteriales bacterium]|nr:HYR domain-containing protein [Flavobacteriales bacterium]